MVELILGSSSPARASVLKKLQLPFVQVAPDVDETPLADETPQQLVKRLAIAKAEKVAANYNNAIIIGCDQVAMVNGQPIGKPQTEADAVKQLMAVSGDSITFYSGMCVWDARQDEYRVCIEPYTIHFKPFTEHQVKRYVMLDQPLQCAGAFRSEGLGIAMASRYEGDDPNTIIGLPLIRLIEFLQEFDLNVLEADY